MSFIGSDLSGIEASKDEMLQAMGRDTKKTPGTDPQRTTGLTDERISGFIMGIKHAGMRCAKCNSPDLIVDIHAVKILSELATRCSNCDHSSIEIFQVKDFKIPGLPVAAPDQAFNMTALGKEFSTFMWESRWKCRVRHIGKMMYGIMEMQDTQQTMRDQMVPDAHGNVSWGKGSGLNRKVFGR